MLRVRQGAHEFEMAAYPSLNPGFRELNEVVFLTPPGGPWSLTIDDINLEQRGPGWSWAPDFFAGQVVAHLRGPDGDSRWLLDVAPDPSKLGRDRFQSMLSELILLEPSLVLGTQASTTPTGFGDLEPDDELAALLSLSRLRRWGDEVLRAVQHLERQPHRVLRRRLDSVPLHRARRVSEPALHRLLRTSFVRQQRPFSHLAVAFEPNAQVEVVTVEPNVDSPANRAVLHLLHRVRRRIAQTHTALLASVRKEREDPKAPLRWMTRESFLTQLDHRLAERLRAWPWREVTREDSSAAGMNVLSADPGYAHFGAMAWAALRTGINLEGDAEEFSLSPTWQLFERWCFVKIAEQVRTMSPQRAWRRIHGNGCLLGWVGVDKESELRLLLQQRFPAWDVSRNEDCRSLSREREPDIVLIKRTKTNQRWLVLDAKYRVGRPNVLEAMESAHLYRDSLRLDGAPPVASFLLSPATTGAQWLHESAFQAEHLTGVIDFRGRLSDELLALLG